MPEMRFSEIENNGSKKYVRPDIDRAIELLALSFKEASFSIDDLDAMSGILRSLKNRFPDCDVKGIQKENMRRAYLFIGAYFGWL
ncbi:hypothetical protein ACHJH3_08590 [Campylobacter sp. MOP7]|uniref:hypothetical protein n=1 Tax=Campylobacter canis TaxID=3378588 RepID=UPI00387EA34F